MDMKIVVLGDIHGRAVWKDIIAKEQPDQVIFLGDYVSTHDNVSDEEQVFNLKEILRYKDVHPKTILLRGNHDLQHLGYDWAECSDYLPRVAELMANLKEEFLAKTQWIYVKGNTVFSHAGISKKWLAANNLTLDGINALEPTELFGFNTKYEWDVYGTSPEQPPTWIRPSTLFSVAIPGYDQVVGHTEVKHCLNMKDTSGTSNNLWLCDALGNGSYLVIENDIYSVNNINE
jgi:predicted phosphodiesterase